MYNNIIVPIKPLNPEVQPPAPEPMAIDSEANPTESAELLPHVMATAEAVQQATNPAQSTETATQQQVPPAAVQPNLGETAGSAPQQQVPAAAVQRNPAETAGSAPEQQVPAAAVQQTIPAESSARSSSSSSAADNPGRIHRIGPAASARSSSSSAADNPAECTGSAPQQVPQQQCSRQTRQNPQDRPHSKCPRMVRRHRQQHRRRSWRGRQLLSRPWPIRRGSSSRPGPVEATG